MITWEQASAMNGLWAGLHGCSLTLIMDYDGTLSPFVPNPEDARPYSGIPELLDRLAAAGCRLVFVTGRDCRQLPVFLDLKSPPEVWGSHGAERLRADGRIESFTLGQLRGQGLTRARAWAESAGYGLAVESKPGCLSFHVRAMAEALRGRILNRAREAWTHIAGEHDLELRAFDGGVELRCAGVHKGLAVATVLTESEPDSRIFYLGDDQTDEDGFVALKGRGVGILVRSVPRETQADWWLRPPDELFGFLERILDALSRS
ncbi:MAG: trehalose-phosphatase [Proteobacteria bacterium]|nr:trehalose-phosphatase [Pseudomonadota bacterium]